MMDAVHEYVSCPTNLYPILLIIFTSIFLYYKHHKCYNYWRRQGVDGPTPLPFFGNNLDVISDTTLGVWSKRWQKYGPVYGIYSGSTPQLVIGDPDMLRDALVKDWYVFADRVGHDYADGNPASDMGLPMVSGNKWKRMRSIISPTFSSKKMKIMFKIMFQCSQKLVQNINNQIKNSDANTNMDTMDGDADDEHINNGTILDIASASGCFSMDVIAKCCFGIETNSFEDKNNIFVKHVQNFFHTPNFKMWIKNHVPGFIRKFIGFTMWPKTCINFLADVSRCVITQRLDAARLNVGVDGKKIRKNEDYIDLLIEASGHTLDPNGNKDGGSDKTDASLTMDEMIANSIIFLAAGFDTTSMLISLAIYHLSLDQDAQQTLYDELCQQLIHRRRYEDADRDADRDAEEIFDYESVMNDAKYLDAVINETLRLYPITPQYERQVLKDYEFVSKDGNKRIKVSKGSSIWIPAFNIQREEKYWKEPLKFDPKRFLPDCKYETVPYTFLPFGAGPRNCVGMRFALMEAKIAVSSLILNFKFSKCPQTDVPLNLDASTILLSPKRVVVRVDTRHGNNSGHGH